MIYFNSKTAYLHLEENGIKEITQEEIYEQIKDKKELSIDIETTKKYNKYENEGLDPFTSNIVMFQIGIRNQEGGVDSYVIDLRDNKLYQKIINLLENKDIVKIGHNLKFEYKHIFEQYKIRINNLYDTMLVDQIIYNGHITKRFNLKEVTYRHTGVVLDKTTATEFLTIGSKPFTLKQILYGAGDVEHPIHIKDKQELLINKLDLAPCVRLEMLFLPVLGDIEYKGMHFDKDKWILLYDDNYKDYLVAKKALDDLILSDPTRFDKFIEKQLDMFDPTVYTSINWGSSQQVVQFLKVIGIEAKEKSKYTGKIALTANATVLKTHLIKHGHTVEQKKFVDKYVQFKQLEQLVTTFGKDFLKYVNPITGRIHSNYKQLLKTGRISSSFPNLQNIPSDARFRSCFNTDTSSKIINADYSGQETVILANKSHEYNMLKLLADGGDMHSFVTRYIFPELIHLGDKAIKELYPDKRQISKSAGFAIQYGGDGYTISKNTGIPQKLGERAYNAYFKAFPDMKDYFRQVQNKTKKDGYIMIDDITRRKYFYTPAKNEKEQSAINRLALNFPIQGAAGSITKFAAIKFRKWILEKGLQDIVGITNLVHDEINVEICTTSLSLGEIMNIARKLEDCMAEAGDVWCKVHPLRAKAVISNYWGH